MIPWSLGHERKHTSEKPRVTRGKVGGEEKSVIFHLFFEDSYLPNHLQYSIGQKCKNEAKYLQFIRKLSKSKNLWSSQSYGGSKLGGKDKSLTFSKKIIVLAIFDQRPNY